MATLTRSERGRGESGQAIVELALTLPLLLLVVLGVFDFGLMFQRYEVVTNAAREAARLAVLTGEFTPAQAQEQARLYLQSGGIPVPATPDSTLNCTAAVSPGAICIEVHSDTVTLSTTPAKTVNVKVATVRYDYPHVFVGPIMRLFGGSLGTAPLKATSKMRAES